MRIGLALALVVTGSLVVLAFAAQKDSPPPLSAPSDAKSQAKAAAFMKRWSPKANQALKSQGYDPEKLATEMRARLKGMSAKDRDLNKKILNDVGVWSKPVVTEIVARNQQTVTGATRDMAASGLATPPSAAAIGHARVPNFPNKPSDQSGSTKGTPALQEFDLALPLDEHSTYDDGSSFLGDQIHIFNGGQIISPNWSTRISAAKAVTLPSHAMTLGLDIDLATDREYFAGAFIAYAYIGSSVTVAIQDMEGHDLASREISLGGATAPFIGQSHPHINETVPVTLSLDRFEHGIREFKVRVTGYSRSTLLGPGVVSDDVLIGVRRVHVRWIAF